MKDKLNGQKLYVTYPNYTILILFFDTETNGLPYNFKASYKESSNWPRLIQIAWIIYDDQKQIISTKMSYIKPLNFSIPPDATAIHGITEELANKKGLFLEDVLLDFENDLINCHSVVAHNMDFDQNIYMSECFRHNFDTIFDSKKLICTMKASTHFCNIPGPYGLKWPKLSELHTKLFGEDFEYAHDALADIIACARCYWKLKDLYLI